MLRIWSESVPMGVARRSGTLRLLERGPIHPLFAVHYDADLSEVARTLKACAERGLAPGIWPLLADADGYWASERNAAVYFDRVASLLDALSMRSARVSWVGVDLEPPIAQIERVRRGGARALWHEVGRNLEPEAFEAALKAFRRGLALVRARGARALAVTLPVAAWDLGRGRPVWQDAIEAPWGGVGWDRAGVMAYGTLISGYSHGLIGARDARALHDVIARRMRAALGERAHLSVGVTGVGKLGDEPHYSEPRELGLDVGAARAAGIEDIGVYSLGGILGRSAPEAWIEAARSAPPYAAPPTPRARALEGGAALVRAILSARRIAKS